MQNKIVNIRYKIPTLENNKSIRLKLMFGIFFLLFGIFSNAQCAMCRAVLESEEGGQQAEAVNDGIVYLMAFPYILVAIIGYVVYRLKTKNKEKV